MKYMKKIAVLGMAVAMLATSVTGCGELKDTDTIITVGDEEVSAGVVNFYARYIEATYESYYASITGSDNMWEEKTDGDNTYEEEVKDDVVDTIQQMVLISQHAKDYDLTLTDEEKEKISEIAQKFFDANELESKEKVSGTKENVEKVLTLYTLQEKARPFIVADIDKEVSDEEAAQKSMTYVQFGNYKEDENGQSVALTDEEKEQAKKDAQALLDGAKKSKKSFEKYAEKEGYEPVVATFDSESENINAELLPFVDELKEGEFTEVVETEAGYFVAEVTSMLDREATDAKKQDILSEREDELFEETIEKWKGETDIKVHKGNLKKISFTSLGVTMLQEEELPYAQSSDTAGTTQDTGATEPAE